MVSPLEHSELPGGVIPMGSISRRDADPVSTVSGCLHEAAAVYRLGRNRNGLTRYSHTAGSWSRRQLGHFGRLRSHLTWRSWQEIQAGCRLPDDIASVPRVTARAVVSYSKCEPPSWLALCMSIWINIRETGTDRMMQFSQFGLGTPSYSLIELYDHP
jgi:hypothetical protein